MFGSAFTMFLYMFVLFVNHLTKVVRTGYLPNCILVFVFVILFPFLSVHKLVCNLWNGRFLIILI